MPLHDLTEEYRTIFVSLCAGNHGIGDIVANGSVCLDNTVVVLSHVEVVAFAMTNEQLLEEFNVRERIIAERTFESVLVLACCYCQKMITEIMMNIGKFRAIASDSVLFGDRVWELSNPFKITDLILDKDPVMIKFLREIPIWICWLQKSVGVDSEQEQEITTERETTFCDKFPQVNVTKQAKDSPRKRKKIEKVVVRYDKTIDILTRVSDLLRLINIATGNKK